LQIRLTLAACLACLLAPTPAALAVREVALTELIESLREQGFNILYSSDLVNRSIRVSVADDSIEDLAQALASVGLSLRREDSVWVVTRGEQETPDIDLHPQASEPVLESVIVTGSMHSFPGSSTASSYRLSTDDLLDSPVLASDPLRASLRLPGVQTVGITAKPRIRGGLLDELLIMQDGVELLEPFHLADYHSAYSSFDYHNIESVDVYTGGFPSRYGNRMSGVMDISNDWSELDYNTNLGVSSFASFINTRHQFAGEHPGSWVASYRRGDLSDLTDYIQSRSGDPRYEDGSLRFNVALSDRLGFDAGAVYARDDVEFRDQEERAISKIDNAYLWSRLVYQPREQLQGALALSWVEFKRDKDLRSFEEEPKGGLLEHRQEVSRVALRNDYSWLRAGVLHEFGWQLEHSESEYRHVSEIDRGDLADIIGTERIVQRDIRLEPDGWSGGVYWAGEWRVGERWLLQPGLRWDFQDYYLGQGSDHQVSPRLGLAYELSDAVRFRFSLGRFYQPEGVQELQVLDGIEVFYQPQRSDQVIAGIEYREGPWAFVGELYYKHYDNLKGRFENIFNPFVLLPEMEPDRVGFEPDNARAVGVDLDLEYEFNDHLTGQLRYSFMDAEDEIDGQWIDRRWSQEHTVNSALVWRKDNFSASLALAWHSGWRTTELPEFVPFGERVPLVDVLNNKELRSYFSLDFSARYGWAIGKTYLQVYADISNVTDRKNQAGIDFDIDEVEDPEGYVITPDADTLLGRVPSVGFTLSF